MFDGPVPEVLENRERNRVGRFGAGEAGCNLVCVMVGDTSSLFQKTDRLNPQPALVEKIDQITAGYAALERSKEKTDQRVRSLFLAANGIEDRSHLIPNDRSRTQIHLSQCGIAGARLPGILTRTRR